MKVGAAQMNITPQPGIELAGFAIRPQPSREVLDPLWVRALFLEEGPERLLWVHCDLLGLEQYLADRLRRRLGREAGMPPSRVVVSATHTHSAPATIQLTGCGQVSPDYVKGFEQQAQAAARLAQENAEPCRFVAVDGSCTLGVDRRHQLSGHTDPRVGALGWLRPDGSFKAAFVDYTMHPVSLRADLISADWPGETARVLTERLPGRPVTLVSSGACGNINPPAAAVAPEQMRDWGRHVAHCVLPLLLERGSKPDLHSGELQVTAAAVDLPSEKWNLLDVDRYADACLADPSGKKAFGDQFAPAVETWRSHMKDRLHKSEPLHARTELTAIRVGRTVILTVNGEAFSRLPELVGTSPGRQIYVVNCANGMLGYLPTAQAYDEGGYEVLWAMLFYNLPRIAKGGLELLAGRAQGLVRTLK